MGNTVITKNKTFTDAEILSGACSIGNSIACDELSIDTLEVAVDCSEDVPTRFEPADADGLLTLENKLFGVRPHFRIQTSDPSDYVYGEPVEYRHDGALIGKFFMSSVKRTGKFVYEILCTSAIGLLDNDFHYGGLYNGTSMSVILADIIHGIVPCTLAQVFQSLPIYGWLPKATRRENLQQLLFAAGASVRKDTAGVLEIAALSAKDPVSLSENRIFMGGSVDYATPVTMAEVYEHSYLAFPQDKSSTLYEGEVPAEPLLSPKGTNLNGSLVTFEGPMHDLSVENGSILERGDNYAVLGQSSECKLTGKEYTHTTRVIRAGTPLPRALAEGKDNTVTVKDATLVSLANSENAAERVLAYYGAAKQIQADFVVGRERPGDPVHFVDPFDEPTEGFLKSMALSMGGKLRASAVVSSGYLPTGIGNYYTKILLISSSGTFTVPAESKGKIRLVLIGGGNGGQTGAAGAAGGRGSHSANGDGGAGGAGGSGGEGGKIFTVTRKAAPGETFSVDLGGGASGGSAGSETRFASHTSADGKSSSSGYTDQFTGAVYATAGARGLDGGKGCGGDGEGNSVAGNRPGLPGGDGEYHGYTGHGGSGGGAAVGADGGTGTDGSVEPNQGNPYANGGAGGDGGNGSSGAAATRLGTGGQGGHGGGGGGGGGAAQGSGSSHEWYGSGGDGGSGGSGGPGAGGCVIVYY